MLYNYSCALLSQDAILRQQQQQLCRYRTIASCGRYAIRYNSTVANPHFPKLSLAYYKKTYYLRDAQGNIMATYNRTYAGESIQDLTMSFSLVERPIYGSSRIANYVDSVQLVSLDETVSEDFVYYDSPDILSHTNGFKHFELTNHLGNVMAVVSDKRTPIITGSEITGYTPELLIAKDYYPFGMEMSGRYIGAGNEDPMNEYRFGFQGQEKDDEWTGQTGSHLNYKYRMYDSRIARFFAIDPLAAKYPYNSTYAFSENRVIDCVELEGLERMYYSLKIAGGTPQLTHVGTWTLYRSAWTGKLEGYDYQKVVRYKGEEYSFSKTGHPDAPYMTIANLEYWNKNSKKFVNENGEIADFSEIFVSHDDLLSDIACEVVLDIVSMLGGETGGAKFTNGKYEKWGKEFPVENLPEYEQKKVAEEKKQRDKDLNEIEQIELVPTIFRSTEEDGMLNVLKERTGTATQPEF
ncbi:MAG: hypothetical protein PHH30_03715 [Bacteroidales bacterium]|nr:hypothetical protein [Bacteroidales bacterium]